jgi:heat shock protein HslJ
MTNAGRAWVAAAVSVLLIGGFLAADALDDEQATGGALADTRWVVTEMPGVALVPDALPSVEFTATQIQASGGCNSMGGAYTWSEGAIDVAALSSTLIGCSTPIATQEAAFSARLQAATSYAVDGEVLRLDGDQGSIVFARA